MSTKTNMAFDENQLIFVTMTTTTRNILEFSSKWRYWQKLTNFRRRKKNLIPFIPYSKYLFRESWSNRF